MKNIQTDLTTEINKYITDFEETYLPDGFIWRNGQKEVVIQIAETYLNKTHNFVICYLPTGTGKSIIAMCASYVLNQYKKKGYILTSEVSLQDQYENDIRNFHLPYGCVKGVDNYICTVNMEKHSLGQCKYGENPKKSGCYDSCPYYSARDFAKGAETSILNYNYWMVVLDKKQSNENDNESDEIFNGNSNVKDNKKSFTPRDFTICDEGHKVIDIVQGHCSPKLSKVTNEKIEKLTSFFKTYNVYNHTNDADIIKNTILLIEKENNQDVLLQHLTTIYNRTNNFNTSIKKLTERVKIEYKNKKPPREWREAIGLSNWLVELQTKLKDYIFIINETTTRNIVKNPNVNEIVFNCLDERYMVQKYFLDNSGFTVLMSATFYDPKQFMLDMNVKSAKFIKMDSLFNFDKSPIYFYPDRKMSYKQFDNNKDWLFNKVNDILDNHKNENGIIHSVSFDLAIKIRDNLKKEHRGRIFVYNGTDEKRQVLDMMDKKSNKVIIGPSILSGVDLKDDLCRFIIFPKIPYASLMDKLVSAKLNINPTWYSWNAVVNIIQGVGRGVRSEGDYCHTYILDGCFSDLYHHNKSMFPLEIINRIEIVKE